MFGAYERVDEILRVNFSEDWSLLGDEGKDRQQGPMHWRACWRIIRCNAALAFEQIRHWFALIPAMAASNQLLPF